MSKQQLLILDKDVYVLTPQEAESGIPRSNTDGFDILLKIRQHTTLRAVPLSW
jgi:hypothetical protein